MVDFLLGFFCVFLLIDNENQNQNLNDNENHYQNRIGTSFVILQEPCQNFFT